MNLLDFFFLIHRGTGIRNVRQSLGECPSVGQSGHQGASRIRSARQLVTKASGRLGHRARARRRFGAAHALVLTQVPSLARGLLVTFLSCSACLHLFPPFSNLPFPFQVASVCSCVSMALLPHGSLRHLSRACHRSRSVPHWLVLSITIYLLLES